MFGEAGVEEGVSVGFGGAVFQEGGGVAGGEDGQVEVGFSALFD